MTASLLAPNTPVPDNGQPNDRPEPTDPVRVVVGWIDRRLPGDRVDKDECWKGSMNLQYPIVATEFLERNGLSRRVMSEQSWKRVI